MYVYICTSVPVLLAAILSCVVGRYVVSRPELFVTQNHAPEPLSPARDGAAQAVLAAPVLAARAESVTAATGRHRRHPPLVRAGLTLG